VYVYPLLGSAQFSPLTGWPVPPDDVEPVGQFDSPSVVPSITGVAAARVGAVVLVPDAAGAGAAAPAPLAPGFDAPPPPPPPQPARISKAPIRVTRKSSRSNIACSMPWLIRNTWKQTPR